MEEFCRCTFLCLSMVRLTDPFHSDTNTTGRATRDTRGNDDRECAAALDTASAEKVGGSGVCAAVTASSVAATTYRAKNRFARDRISPAAEAMRERNEPETMSPKKSLRRREKGAVRGFS